MKKVILLLLTFTITFQLTCAQNMLHYALSSNGEKEWTLFPENANGDVVFSSVVEVPFSADTILMAADSYLTSLNAPENCEVKTVSKSNIKNVYSIQLNVGKQLWAVELFGSPLFVVNRDASHVKFTCVVEARKGKYKYSLIDFETNRRTLPGDAKNDGQPNVIHWQRINSILKVRSNYCSSHNASKRQAQEDIYSYNEAIAEETYLYFDEYNEVLRFEDGLKNLTFAVDDFEDIETKGAAKENKYQALKEVADGIFSRELLTQTGPAFNFGYIENRTKIEKKPFTNGSLLSKGNNVFVTSGDENYEQAGAQEMRKQIYIDNFWNVVNDEKLAHFIIEYHVDTDGKDKAYIILKSQDSTAVTPQMFRTGTSESIIENRQAARRIYVSNLVSLMKKIEENKIPKDLKIFDVF